MNWSVWREEKKALFEVNTLAFSAKATLRTKRHAASFKYIYLYSWQVEWKRIKQAGNRRKRPHVNTASLCYISWTKTLLHSSSRRQLSGCECRGYTSLCFCVLICQCLYVSASEILKSVTFCIHILEKNTEGETKQGTPEREAWMGLSVLLVEFPSRSCKISVTVTVMNGKHNYLILCSSFSAIWERLSMNPHVNPCVLRQKRQAREVRLIERAA